jgi:hypothetical protein
MLGDAGSQTYLNQLICNDIALLPLMPEHAFLKREGQMHCTEYDTDLNVVGIPGINST